jgi:hypothetical protein
MRMGRGRRDNERGKEKGGVMKMKRVKVGLEEGGGGERGGMKEKGFWLWMEFSR